MTRPRRRHPLAATEMAEAAALGDLAAAAVVATRLLPAGPLGWVLAAFSLAVLGHRHRVRAVAVGVLVAVVVGFLGGGLAALGAVTTAGVIGAIVGIGTRRGRAAPVSGLVAVATLALPSSALAVGLLAVLPVTRRLLLASLGTTWRGLARTASASGTPEVLVRAGDVVVRATVEAWWAVLPGGAAAVTMIAATVLARAFRRPLHRLRPPAADASLEPAGPGHGVAPLPLSLAGVGVRRTADGPAAPAGVDLELAAGRFVTVAGPNGSGKSTLARVLAGREPTEGTVVRAGDAGLGAAGGTALVFQRPESQVLGVRVLDDVLWGAEGADPADAGALLARVGLAGTGERETATLSGGELARLALAAVLARRPALVVSDESTAMLDPDGRDAVLGLLRGLARDGAGVVHVTHHPGEVGDDALVLGEGPAPAAPGTALPPPVPVDGTGGRVRAAGVEVVHDPGTPWAHRALWPVDLDVPAGATVLVTGPNGSGKSTLAAVLAGLRTPSAGTVTLDGEPLRNGRGGALMALQHARLALLRDTVAADVADAAGPEPAPDVDAALAAVGLDPGHYRDRGVDELSGGEQRRVLLAGLLAARPRVLLLDEPLAGLDDAAREALHAALARVRAAGITLVVTTHDADALADLADATLTVVDGRVRGDGAAASEEPGARRRVRARSILRTLPGTSPARELWAGTKVGLLLATVVVLAVAPSWPVLGGAAVVLALWALAGRVPRGAWPRPPAVLLVWLPIAGFALAGAAPPTVVVGRTELGLGGPAQVLLLAATNLVSLLGAVLLVWTTPTGAIPPLAARAARCTRAVRVRLGARPAAPPRWPVAIALGLRMTPMLLDEARTIATMLGQRRRGRAGEQHRNRGRGLGREIARGVALAVTTTVRRAGEVADAVVARGGVGTIAGPDARPGRRDLLAVVVVAAVLGAALVLGA